MMDVMNTAKKMGAKLFPTQRSRGIEQLSITVPAHG